MASQNLVNICSGNGLLPDKWQHLVITWTNVDLSSMRSYGIGSRVISQEMLIISIRDMCLKIIILLLQPHRPGANEFN